MKGSEVYLLLPLSSVTLTLLFIFTAGKGGVARDKGEGEKEKEYITCYYRVQEPTATG